MDKQISVGPPGKRVKLDDSLEKVSNKQLLAYF